MINSNFSRVGNKFTNTFKLIKKVFGESIDEDAVARKKFAVENSVRNMKRYRGRKTWKIDEN